MRRLPILCKPWRAEPRHGFTLVEMTLVVALLALVAGLAVLRLDDFLARSRLRAAERDLQTLREALLGSATLPGYLPDMEGIPGFSPAYTRLHNLLGATNVIGRGGLWLDHAPQRRGYADFSAFTNWNAELGRGWRGPYLRANSLPRSGDGQRQGLYPAPLERRCQGDATFAERGFAPKPPPSLRRLPPEATPYALPGDLALTDPWGNPYVLQVPPAEAFDAPGEHRRFHYARLVSAGQDGVLSTPCFDFEAPPRSRPGYTNHYHSALTPDTKRLLRLAGMQESGGAAARGDDLVLFINRMDIYESDE